MKIFLNDSNRFGYRLRVCNSPLPILAFTGHRPDKLGGYDINDPFNQRIIAKMRATILEIKPRGIISGMALGVDTYAAILANELSIPWVAAIPFIGQQSNWPLQSQLQYNSILSTAKQQIIISDVGFSSFKMQLRNIFMVENCTTLIAVWNGSAGGTGNCVKYAKSKSINIIYINPTQL